MKPCHVTFSPVVCTVDAVMFTRKFVADKESEIRQTADTIFKLMETRIERFAQNPDSSRFSSHYIVLKEALSETRAQFEWVFTFLYLFHMRN